MKSPITDLLEHLWEFKTESKRESIRNWRRLFKAYNFVPRRHLAVIYQGNGHALVESESRAGNMHSVDIGQHGCSCEFHTFEKLPCKHMKIVQRLVDEDILPGEKTKL